MAAHPTPSCPPHREHLALAGLVCTEAGPKDGLCEGIRVLALVHAPVRDRSSWEIQVIRGKDFARGNVQTAVRPGSSGRPDHGAHLASLSCNCTCMPIRAPHTPANDNHCPSEEWHPPGSAPQQLDWDLQLRPIVGLQVISELVQTLQ